MQALKKQSTVLEFHFIQMYTNPRRETLISQSLKNRKFSHKNPTPGLNKRIYGGVIYYG